MWVLFLLLVKPCETPAKIANSPPANHMQFTSKYIHSLQCEYGWNILGPKWGPQICGQMWPSAAVTRQLRVSPWLSEEAVDGWAETCGLKRGLTRKHFAMLVSSTRQWNLEKKNIQNLCIPLPHVCLKQFQCLGNASRMMGKSSAALTAWCVEELVPTQRFLTGIWGLGKICLVDLWSNQCSQFEFQLRMDHPERGCLQDTSTHQGWVASSCYAWTEPVLIFFWEKNNLSNNAVFAENQWVDFFKFD